MSEITRDVVTQQLLDILREGMEGSPHPWSYFTDPGAESSLLGVLDKLDAEQASQPRGGTSIAAQVHHVTFALEASAGWIRGERKSLDWAQSWNVSQVDPEGWQQLLSQLKSAYADLRQAIETSPLESAEEVGGAIGAVAHLAYHLGAIRQKVRL